MQLDGETDWKLRRAAAPSQSLESDQELLDYVSDVHVEAPKKDIYDFSGTFTTQEGWPEGIYLAAGPCHRCSML